MPTRKPYTPHASRSAHTSSTSLKRPVVHFDEGTACTHIELSSNPEVQHPVSSVNNSAYTSHGKKKATPADPIRDPEDLERLLEYCLTTGYNVKRLRNYTLIVVGISLGIRTCDLLRLKIKDVINPDGTVKSELAVFESKTKKMLRPVLNRKAKEALAKYINSMPKFSFNYYLFPKSNQTPTVPLDVRAVYGILNRANEQLKLPYHLGVHTFRKTFAYWTIQLHYDNLDVMNSLQFMLNHDSMRTTLFYSGITKENLAVMYNDMAKIFDKDSIPTTTKSDTKKINELFNSLSLDLEADE